MFRRAVFAWLASGLAAGAAAQGPAPPAPPALSGDWRLAVRYEEPEVGRVLGFADAGSLARSGDEVRFWLEYRVERAPDGADGFRGYVTGDCSNYAYGSVSLAMLAGAQVVRSGGEESGLTAAPGTHMRTAMDSACAGRFLSGRVDPIAFAKAEFER